MNTSRTFETERLQLGIYLHATGRLRLVACESNDGRCVFVFADPDGVGPQAELEYEQGAKVSATALFASQKFLRRHMSDALNRKTGETDYEHGKN